MPLQEKDFIQNSLRKNPVPAFIWLVVIACLAAILWGGSGWYLKFLTKETEQSPFLQVTNRQMSLFLWQFPEYMRINSDSKSSYLPGFQYENKISLFVEQADKYVQAPPSLLFLYHTWSRLVKDEFSYRPIAINEFQKFLEDAPEWLPQNWPGAPKGYSDYLASLPQKSRSLDLKILSEAELPLEVRQAFIGWKNYFKEGDAINSIQPTLQDINQFISKFPHYARNYWRNIMLNSYPNYLISTISNGPQDQTLANDEIAPFLRVALYNFLQTKSELTNKSNRIPYEREN